MNKLECLLDSLQHCSCIHISDTASEGIDIISGIESSVNIIFMLITGVCAIIGILLISKFKEKAIEATFSFWTQLRIRLLRIENRLKNNNGLVNNLYSNDVKSAWSDTGISPSTEDVIDFYNMVEETLHFMENAEDQMPAYRGWVDDYNCVVSFFEDMICYDIRDTVKKFKYNGNESLNERDKLCEEKCKVMKSLIDGILDKQREAEKKINRR